jgi:asparagine synthase (glutamine-hydrolysing)
MCGICGILKNVPDQIVDPDLLDRMNSKLIHRGPDSQGFFVNRNLGMAMRRLSIIDIAGGDQPISNEDGSIVVMFNGEIYNFIELRVDLEKFGHNFTTNSDTEVIVHAYEQWGDDALLRFNGMFAISLWDARKKRLLLARDRMGKKPIYWHFSDLGLVWASELKALIPVPWIERDIDPIALHHYLTLQYVPDPLCIFKQVKKLPAAHKLVLEIGKSPEITRWWQLRFETKWKISENEAITHARKLLTVSVERRLISEVPLGAFLSGGIDSSIIVALMATLSPSPVKTFSIGYDERHYSETRFARMVAKRYNTEHHEFFFKPADMIGVIGGVVNAVDEPFADPAALPLYELARQARSHVTVALCGDGGDETMAGYRRYVLDRWLQAYLLLPAWINQGLVPTVANLIPESPWIPEDRNPVTGLRRLGQFSRVTNKASLVRWGSYFSHEQKLKLYSPDLTSELDNIFSEDLLAQQFDQAVADDFLDRTLYTDHVTYLAGDLLPKTDRVCMAHSLEARSPFLDPDWVEWTARLPNGFKVRRSQTKYLLRTAFADMIPSEILNRGKQGFGVPIGVWLQRELFDWTYSSLFENPALPEWFNIAEIQRYWNEHLDGRMNHSKRIWALLMFALWVENYYECQQ